MTPLPVVSVILRQGEEGPSVAVTPRGPIRRSIGSAGDPLIVTVPPAAWAAAAIDPQEPVELVVDAAGPAPLVLKGYRVRATRHAEYGEEIGTITISPAVLEVALDTELRYLREGRGGLVTIGLLNELDENGLVDTEASTYRTTQQLVNEALAALGIDYDDCPPEVNLAPDGTTAIDGPGPLDWGNQRPLSEVEGVLFRVGYSLALGNDGVVRVVRLARAGEPVTLPVDLADLAEPYEPDVSPGIRGQTIVVTSGATRTTAILRRHLGQLAWVRFDERLNTWMGQTDWEVVYPDEAGPGDLDAFRAGLTGPEVNPIDARNLASIFTAVGLGVDDYERHRRFVNLPSELDPDAAGDLLPFLGTPGVVEARCAIDMGGEQFANAPVSDEDPLIRIGGLTALAREGVLILPQDAVYARLTGGAVGRRSDMRALGAADLAVVFACESNTREYLRDYFVVGFRQAYDEGTPVLEQLDEAELLAAVQDPDVVKVAAPFLRAVVLREEVDEEEVDTPLNRDTLVAVAEQIAWGRIADEELASAVVRLNGIVDVSPGGLGGQVSSVTWDPYTVSTTLLINQHERPGSVEELQRRAVGDSIAAGVGGVQLIRSNASLADARAQMTADRQAGGTPGSPDTNAVQRGRDRASAGTPAATGEGPTPGMGLPRVRELTRIKAILNPAELPPTSIGPNRWIYHWQECRRNGRSYTTTGALRTSTTHGRALNDAEGRNLATGVLGTGVEAENITAGWALKPIGPACVELEGPYWDTANSEWVWYFCLPNQVDGACPAPTPPPPEGGAS